MHIPLHKLITHYPFHIHLLFLPLSALPWILQLGQSINSDCTEYSFTRIGQSPSDLPGEVGFPLLSWPGSSECSAKGTRSFPYQPPHYISGFNAFSSSRCSVSLSAIIQPGTSLYNATWQKGKRNKITGMDDNLWRDKRRETKENVLTFKYLWQCSLCTQGYGIWKWGLVQRKAYQVEGCFTLCRTWLGCFRTSASLAIWISEGQNNCHTTFKRKRGSIAVTIISKMVIQYLGEPKRW